MVKCKGFTLVELSMVLAIIGLLAVSIIGGMTYVNSAKITSAISLTQDISSAVNAFKQQYHMLPGDMGITTEIPNVRAECLTGGANAGNNDGQINATEQLCVPEVLYRAGLIKVDQANGWAVFKTYYGNVNVIATSLSAVGSASFLPSITHVIELLNITCDVALTIDSKIDDGNLLTGKVQSPATTTCVYGSSTLTTVDIAL